MRVLGAVLVAVMLAVAVLFAIVPETGAPITCEMDLPDFGVVEAACELCPVGERLAGGLVFECEIRNVVTCTTANRARLCNELPDSAAPQSRSYSATNHKSEAGRFAAGV